MRRCDRQGRSSPFLPNPWLRTDIASSSVVPVPPVSIAVLAHAESADPHEDSHCLVATVRALETWIVAGLDPSIPEPEEIEDPQQELMNLGHGRVRKNRRRWRSLAQQTQAELEHIRSLIDARDARNRAGEQRFLQGDEEEVATLRRWTWHLPPGRGARRRRRRHLHREQRLVGCLRRRGRRKPLPRDLPLAEGVADLVPNVLLEAPDDEPHRVHRRTRGQRGCGRRSGPPAGAGSPGRTDCPRSRATGPARGGSRRDPAPGCAAPAWRGRSPRAPGPAPKPRRTRAGPRRPASGRRAESPTRRRGSRRGRRGRGPALPRRSQRQTWFHRRCSDGSAS